MHKVVSYLRYYGRAGRTAAIAAFDPKRPIRAENISLMFATNMASSSIVTASTLFLPIAAKASSNSFGACTGNCWVVAFTAPTANQEGAPTFVTNIPPGYRDWRLISVAHEEGNYVARFFYCAAGVHTCAGFRTPG
jgi:hypothetical protein